MLALTSPNEIPPLQYDWTMERGAQLFGLVGYPSGTYVCYGSGHFRIPITIETFGVILVVLFLVCCAWWGAYRRGDENAA